MMTDDYGLGALPSPPDERDWPVELLYASAGMDAAVPPATFVIPAPYPPILNQHTTPQCVAFSSSLLKQYEDLRDTGRVDLDEAGFFSAIGGGPNGAVVRVALQQLVTTGYPEAGAGHPDRHRITAYYSVPIDENAIKSALVDFGPLLLSTIWPRSWFKPGTSAVLPKPDVTVGGHAIVAVGYDSRGLRLRNSWGTLYGLLGDVYMPWAYLGNVREAWKAIDQVIPPPPPTVGYTLHIAPGAILRRYTVDAAGRITRPWTDRNWARASSAPCSAPVVRKTIDGRSQATTVTISAGPYKGWVVRAYLYGVSVTKT